MMTSRFVVLAFAALAANIIALNVANSVHAADMTFQFINDTDRPLNLKLFSRGESLQIWPAKTKAYSVRPVAEIQQLKISCTEGESICWGAWMTVQSVSGQISGSQRSTSTFTILGGVGERGIRDCPACCQVCKEDALAPVVKLNTGSNMGSDVR